METLKRFDIIVIGTTHKGRPGGWDPTTGTPVDGDYSTAETALVTYVEDTECGQRVTFVPVNGYWNSVRCGFGGFTNREHMGPYATVYAHKIGEHKPRPAPSMPSLVGNPGFDLMM